MSSRVRCRVRPAPVVAALVTAFVTLAVAATAAAATASAQAPPAEAADRLPRLTPAQARELEVRVANTYAKVAPAVVRLHQVNEKGESAGSFVSGVIIDADGTVLTCAHHNLPPRTPILVELSDGRRPKGSLLGRFAMPEGKTAPDMALARIDEPGPWPAAPLAPGAAPAAGETCLGVGYPGTLPDRAPPLLRVGRVLAREPDWPFLQATTTYESGDSGGPLFDLAGRVLAVVNGSDAFGPTQYQPVHVLAAARQRLAAGEVIEQSADVATHRRLPLAQRAAFTPAMELEGRLAQPRRATVEVRSGSRPVALGVIVRPDGWAITKRTLVEGRDDLACRLNTSQTTAVIFNAKVAAVSAPHDLALLKIEAADLHAANWAPQPPRPGTFVAAVMPVTHPSPIGVVGAAVAEVAPPPWDIAQVPLMVDFGPDGKGEARIDQVLDTPEADDFRHLLKGGDVLTSLGGAAIKTQADFQGAMARLLYAPGVEVRPENAARLRPAPGSFAGEPVAVTVRRGGRDVHVRIHKVHSSIASPLMWYTHPKSIRRDGFPAAFAHDAAVPPHLCGGPVADLDGRVTGINIARADWTRTLAIPADVVQEVTAKLIEQATATEAGTSRPR